MYLETYFIRPSLALQLALSIRSKTEILGCKTKTKTEANLKPILS